MVERLFLTPELVDEANPVAAGERWIADTSVPGFGLRIWSAERGEGKAFALRVLDVDGRSIRRSFNPYESWLYGHLLRSGRTQLNLGEFLDEARNWARNEISKLKGRPTQDELYEAKRGQAAARIQRVTLGQAAESVIFGMRLRGLSEPYVDQIDKLFNKHIPQSLKSAHLHRVSAAKMAAALAHHDVRPGTVRMLKAFVGQIFEKASHADGKLGEFSDRLATEFWPLWKAQHDVRFPELRNLAHDDYEQIFKKLEARSDHWQQALCIRLFFIFRSPLTKVMAGTWAQIYQDHWYSYWPNQRVYWFETREQIDDSAKHVFERIAYFHKREGWDSAHWFPSKYHDLFHTFERLKVLGAKLSTRLARATTH